MEAKLTASTSSTQMLSSSASEGVIGNNQPGGTETPEQSFLQQDLLQSALQTASRYERYEISVSLAEKLAKLNNSESSIKTLSNWCIFRRPKHVVETWGRQFHCAPREQRLTYLYLANEIFQNSRQKGSELEFVGEFSKVLPDALRDMIENGDEFGKKSARRLVNIWEEKKVFGNGTLALLKQCVQQRQASRTTLDRVVSAVKALHVQVEEVEEDVVIGKCTNAAGYLDKAAQEVERDLSSGHTPGPAVVKEVQGQHAVLRDCIEQLGAMETSRTSLVSLLRDALQEQELKLDQVRNHLQVARFQSDRTGDLCRQLQELKETIQVSSAAAVPRSFTHSDVEQSAPVMFASGPRESAAAARKAKLSAQFDSATSSAQRFSLILSALGSEGVIVDNQPAGTETPSSTGDSRISSAGDSRRDGSLQNEKS